MVHVFAWILQFINDRIRSYVQVNQQLFAIHERKLHIVSVCSLEFEIELTPSKGKCSFHAEATRRDNGHHHGRTHTLINTSAESSVHVRELWVPGKGVDLHMGPETDELVLAERAVEDPYVVDET